MKHLSILTICSLPNHMNGLKTASFLLSGKHHLENILKHQYTVSPQTWARNFTINGHVDKPYKGFLLSTMINRAYCLSSTLTAFSKECAKLRATFLNLDYPVNLINSSINKFLRNIDNISSPDDDGNDGTSNIVIPLPFKDQQSANLLKRETHNLEYK